MNTSDDLPEYVLGVDLGGKGDNTACCLLWNRDGKQAVIWSETFKPNASPAHDVLRAAHDAERETSIRPDNVLMDHVDRCRLKRDAHNYFYVTENAEFFAGMRVYEHE